jgi:hypothetical protein
MQQQPDEAAYVRSAAELAAQSGGFEKAREIIKGMIDKGQATPGGRMRWHNSTWLGSMASEMAQRRP